MAFSKAQVAALELAAGHAARQGHADVSATKAGGVRGAEKMEMQCKACLLKADVTMRNGAYGPLMTKRCAPSPALTRAINKMNANPGKPATSTSALVQFYGRQTAQWSAKDFALLLREFEAFAREERSRDWGAAVKSFGVLVPKGKVWLHIQQVRVERPLNVLRGNGSLRGRALGEARERGRLRARSLIKAGATADDIAAMEPLSGEWAGKSIEELLGDLLGGTDYAEDNDDIMDAYERGFYDEGKLSVRLGRAYNNPGGPVARELLGGSDV